MSTESRRPTRREQRRAQTVQEIKALAMDQISSGGPDAVSLSGIVREMSMSPAAVYRYFENRDALVADLVVDAYDDYADSLELAAKGIDPAQDRLSAVLNGSRRWALASPNAYKLIFQTSIGSGKDFASDRTVPAASRSMAVLIAALAAVNDETASPAPDARAPTTSELDRAVRSWAARSGLSHVASAVLEMGLISWTRLHGIISLELGGHLASTGIDPSVLYDAEVAAISRDLAVLTASRAAPQH